MIVKEKFKQEFHNGYYELIDPNHPLKLYIGKDDSGHYAIEYRGDFKPSAIPSSNIISIRQYGDKESRLLIALLDANLLDIFSAFADDVVDFTRDCTSNSEGYSQIVSRYYLWKKMFQVKKVEFTEGEIMGLIGELLFLRDFMIPKYGEINAIQAWSGQERTHKDFSVDNDWYEVKSIASGKELVKISSIEQLNADTNGYLIVHQLEKMSPSFDGITLNKLAHEVFHSLSSVMAKDMLLVKFAECGFDFSKYFDTFVYQLTDVTKYLVDDKFPKLTTTELPVAVAKVQYDLLIAELEPYKIE